MVNTNRKWHVLQVFMCFIIFSVGNVHSKPVKTGGDHTFLPSVEGKIEAILWKYNQNKLVEFDSTGETWYRFKGQGTLNRETGDLILQRLSKADSGVYDSEIQVNGQLQYSTHKIEVIDGVSKPVVKCEVNDTEAKLWCSVNPPVEQPLTWTGPNGFQQTGDFIIIKKSREWHPDSLYNCTAKNEVSEDSGVFKLKDCKGPGPNIIAIILGVLFAVILIVGAGCLIYKWKKNRGEHMPVPSSRSCTLKSSTSQ